MATWSPISGVMSQYDKSAAAGSGPASGYYLKFYDTTNTAISMASASDGSGLLVKAQLDNSGYPVNGSADRFIPFIDQDYRPALYTNSTDADADTIANADWFPGTTPQLVTGSNQAENVLSRDTLNDAVIDTSLQAGLSINIAERTTGNGGGAMWDVVLSSTVTENAFNIVQCTGVGTLSLVLRNSEKGNVKEWGAAGDGSTDDYAVFQAIIDAGDMYIPDRAIYMIGTTIREATSGGARKVKGVNRVFTIVKATPALAASGEPIFWFGNSLGHGNYRLDFSQLKLDGGDGEALGGSGTDGAYGLRAQECGTSFVGDLTFLGCLRCIDAVGCIGTTFGGEKTEVYSSQEGIITTAPIGGGSGLDPDDLLNTESPLTLHANINVIENIWFSAVQKTTIKIDGGLFSVLRCTFQSCVQDITKNIIELNNANEVYDYGGGPIIHGNWFEGGSYKFAIALINTRSATITKNFIVGSNTTNPANFPKEGGIFRDATSTQSVIKDNDIAQFFVGTPTDTRLANGAIYTEGSLYKDDVFDNYVATTQVKPYYEGLPNPTERRHENRYTVLIDPLLVPGAAAATWDSHGIVSNVTKTGTGDFSISFNFNRETLTAGKIFTNTITVGGTFSASDGSHAFTQASTSGSGTGVAGTVTIASNTVTTVVYSSRGSGYAATDTFILSIPTATESTACTMTADSVGGGAFPIDITARTNSSVKSYSVSAFGNGSVSSERIIIHNQSGTLEDPADILISFPSYYVGI